MEPASFFHVAFKVRDIDRSVAFYRDNFAAELLERAAGDADRATAIAYAALSLADKRLYLFDEAPYEAADLVDELDPGFLHIGLVFDDVDQAFEEVTAAGADVVMEPEDFGDLRIAFVHDPAGTRVELLEHI